MTVPVFIVPCLVDKDMQCIAIATTTKKRCRMPGPSKAEREEISNQWLKLQASDLTERRNAIRTIIRLRTCSNGHRQRLREGETRLESLVAAAERTSYSAWEVDAALDGYKQTEFRKYCLRSHDLVTALQREQTRVPADPGVVYAFGSPYKPGFVKIGWAKSSAKRLKVWASCYAEPALICEEQFRFPEQIELLIHLEQAARRYKLRCRLHDNPMEHDEWFQMTEHDARQVITDWKSLTDEYPLYEYDKTLSRKWRSVLPFVTEQTAAGLLAAMEKSRQCGKDQSLPNQQPLPAEHAVWAKEESHPNLGDMRKIDEDGEIDSLIKSFERAGIDDNRQAPVRGGSPD